MRAGVSPSTVSRYLNGSLGLPEKTKRRIDQAIRELDYHPNLVARTLQTGQSRILGLILPDLTNPFFAAVAEAVCDQAYREGYFVLLCATANDREREISYANLLSAGQLDGLIYLGGHSTNSALAEAARSSLPIVIVDEDLKETPGGRVFVDNRRGGYLATEHLLHLGHREIALVGGNPTLYTTRERQLGYEDALLERGIEPDHRWILLGEYTNAFGAQAAEVLLTQPKPPTAIFAASDILAIGILQAARRLGVRIPEDLSLVGFDDIPLAEFLQPPLTTVRQPIEDLGRTAVSVLLASLRKEQTIGCQVLGVRLQIRDSTAQPRRGELRLIGPSGRSYPCFLPEPASEQ